MPRFATGSNSIIRGHKILEISKLELGEKLDHRIRVKFQSKSNGDTLDVLKKKIFDMRWDVSWTSILL